MERGLERDPERAPRPAGDPVHLLEFPLGGSVVEVSVPTTEDSGTARLVAQRATQGAVYHHTCPYTPDVHAFTEGAVAAGIQQIGSIPPKEERERVVAWFHPQVVSRDVGRGMEPTVGRRPLRAGCVLGFN